jgi:IS5 family transposase
LNQTLLSLDPLHKKTRKEVFLGEMNQVVPWATLVALIEPFARGAHQALGGRPPFAVETMLRIHCLQLWWNLSDPAVAEELHECPLYRRFVGLDGAACLPDETRRPSCDFATCWKSTSTNRTPSRGQSQGSGLNTVRLSTFR